MLQANKFKQSIEKQWYGKPSWLWLLAPLSGVFWGLSHLRKKMLSAKAYHAPCPVIIVGNIAVGGTGKTPLIIALANALQRAGFSPAIVSRGYGAAFNDVTLVPPAADPKIFGDEPVLIANSCDCPVIIAKKRVLGVQTAHQAYACNVVLCDDGLQHYALGRSFEIAVFDGTRGVGNGWCLPVGPLRELPSRLARVNFTVINGQTLVNMPAMPTQVGYFSLRPVGWVNVKTGLCKVLGGLPWAAETGNNKQRVIAAAGIGNPQRFFEVLQTLGVFFETKVFADHHSYNAQDFAIANGRPVVMTAKDAVKCRAFAQPNWWYLAVEAELPIELEHAVIEHCQQWPQTQELV